MISTIYLAQAEGTNNFKIGYTSQKPNVRISQLQTGNGSKLTLLKVFKTKYGTKLENRIHREFNTKRIEGEWFVLDKEQVEKFVETCSKHEHNFDALMDNPFTAKLFK